MKRKLICFILVGLACSMLFAWSQIYCPRGCRDSRNPALPQRGISSLDGSHLECPKCGHRWR